MASEYIFGVIGFSGLFRSIELDTVQPCYPKRAGMYI